MANTQTPPAADITLNHKPSGNLFLGTTQQNFSVMSDTLVNLDTIGTGFTDGIEDTGNKKITPGVTGLYLIIVVVAYQQLTAGKYLMMSVRKNGTPVIQGYGISSGTGKMSFCMSNIVPLISTDYLSLYAKSDDGVETVDLLAGYQITYMTVQRIR